MADECCVITGVGPGTGAALARRLAGAWYLAHQPRSSWTFDVQIHPYGESS